MGKTILVVGYGSGISRAVAEKFGSSGYSVALVARTQEKLTAAVSELEAKGVKAAAVPADAGDPASMRAAIAKARAALGPIAAIHWNAYGGAEHGDLLTTDAAAARSVFDSAIVGLLATVQEALPDLEASKEGAVLITNGGFGDINPQVDAYATSSKNMGLALANAAKHKLAGLLAERLKGNGIYVGEVVVTDAVKGTPFDQGNATLEPATIANKFWELFRARTELRARLP